MFSAQLYAQGTVAFIFVSSVVITFIVVSEKQSKTFLYSIYETSECGK